MTTPKWTNQQQRRYLKDRIEAVQARTARQRWDINSIDVTKEPALIRRARKRIADYEAKRKKLATAEIKRLRIDSEVVTVAARTAREKLLFSTPDEALAAVVALEKRYPGAD